MNIDFTRTNCYVNIVGINKAGKRILDSITSDDLEWFLYRTCWCNKVVTKRQNECAIKITGINNHYINKYYINENYDIDFDFNLAKDNRVVTILVYDINDYDKAQKIKKSINNNDVFYAEICINEGNELDEIKAINTREKNAREVLFDMLILLLPCPGFVGFDLADFNNFMEEGYRYGNFIIKGDSITGVVEDTIRVISRRNDVYEVLFMIVGKTFPQASAIPLLKMKYHERWSYIFMDDSFKDYRVLVIYKLKENNSNKKIIN